MTSTKQKARWLCEGVEIASGSSAIFKFAVFHEHCTEVHQFSRTFQFNRQFKKKLETNLWFFSLAKAQFYRKFGFSRICCGDQFFY